MSAPRAPDPPARPRKPRAKVVPIALRRADPVPLVAALVRHIRALRAARNPAAPLFITAHEVVQAIGLTDDNRLPGVGQKPESLCMSTLKALDFRQVNRVNGRKVFMLPPEHELIELQNRINATAPEPRSSNSGPTETAEFAQRRLAAQRAQSGNADT